MEKDQQLELILEDCGFKDTCNNQKDNCYIICPYYKSISEYRQELQDS